MGPRTHTIFVEVDSFFSPRGKVLHQFDHFLAGLTAAQIPCIWITGRTRAQLDEPRRRLGQNHPFIGENGCGVYLPEDYFHLAGSKTIRLGRYTCIPIGKPQPAAADALGDLVSELEISVVPLGKLSSRELSLNTGLPGKEAEQIRMRDFDELFFFAGASAGEIETFCAEAKRRGLAVRRAGSFWALSCGGDLGKCVRELGGLYDRALRAHALRIGLRLKSAAPADGTTQDNGDAAWPSSAFDRTLVVTEETRPADSGADSSQPLQDAPETDTFDNKVANERSFRLGSPTVWDELLGLLRPAAMRRGGPMR